MLTQFCVSVQIQIRIAPSATIVCSMCWHNLVFTACYLPESFAVVMLLSLWKCRLFVVNPLVYQFEYNELTTIQCSAFYLWKTETKIFCQLILTWFHNKFIGFCSPTFFCCEFLIKFVLTSWVIWLSTISHGALIVLLCQMFICEVNRHRLSVCLNKLDNFLLLRIRLSLDYLCVTHLVYCPLGNVVCE